MVGILTIRLLMDFLYFGSGSKAPYQLLSNFARAPIVVTRATLTIHPALALAQPRLAEFLTKQDGFTFPTSEHVWQSTKATTLGAFRAFTTEGRFGRWDANIFAALYSKTDKAKAKFDYWHKRDMLGIQAKLASSAKHAKRLGVTDMDYSRETLAPDVERAVWLAILQLKFEWNATHAEVLRDTGEKQLVEFDKSAGHWGGFIRDGALVGENVMGRYMSETRALFSNDHR